MVYMTIACTFAQKRFLTTITFQIQILSQFASPISIAWTRYESSFNLHEMKKNFVESGNWLHVVNWSIGTISWMVAFWGRKISKAWRKRCARSFQMCFCVGGRRLRRAHWLWWPQSETSPPLHIGCSSIFYLWKLQIILLP